jgi:cellulose synthase/poly-beta-1,6-N-acetylglucosamine synthase-like glycosyltransferase
MPLLTAVILTIVFGALGLKRLLPVIRKRRGQVRFIRETLANANNSDPPRVIVSLSTVPDRIGNLGPTIRSLLKQTRPPDEIVVAIPKFSVREQRPYIVPKYLSRLPRVRVLRCREDWGPATKFIGAIRDELAAGRKDTQIMVVDDDRLYPRDAVETYLFYGDRLPNAALCFRGAAMPSSLDWDDAKMIHARDLREPRPVAVITGCGSYFVQAGFFDQSLWNYSKAPSVAFHIDDIWISGWLSRRGVKRYVVPASAMMRSVRRQRGTVSLNKIPGRQKMNNETITFFKDAWDVFASPKAVRPCDEYDGATTQHRTPSGKGRRL